MSFSELDENYRISDFHFFPEQISSLSNCILNFKISSAMTRTIESICPLIFDNMNQRIAILDLRNQIGTQTIITPEEDIKISIEISEIPLLEGQYSLGIFISDNIGSKDYFNIHKFNIWPQNKSIEEINYEYELHYRGFMNLNFKVINNK